MASIAFFLVRFRIIARTYLHDTATVSAAIDLAMIRERGEHEYQKLFKQVSDMLKYYRTNRRAPFHSPYTKNGGPRRPCQYMSATTDAERAIRLFITLCEMQTKNPYLLAINLSDSGKSLSTHIRMTSYQSGKAVRDIHFTAKADPSLIEFVKGRPLRFYDLWFLSRGVLRYQLRENIIFRHGIYRHPWSGRISDEELMK